MNVHVVICLCLGLAYSSRIKARAKVFAESVVDSDSHSDVAMKGMLLRERYRLDSYLHRHTRATPGVSFPTINSSRREFTGYKEHLGTGSFGDVWQAFDTKKQKIVAVKIFYQGQKYMTWLNADARGRAELEDSARECTLIKKILDNRAKYPLGASRICECYDQYINDAKGTNAVVFLVQEMCGRNLKEEVIAPGEKSRKVDFTRARVLTKQMLQGVAFLQMFDPPLIHHDLKPANVCLNAKGQIKIIDWGALTHGTSSDMYKSTAATPLYMAPEIKNRIKSFEEPWWSYDSYALGIMHMEMVCPMIQSYDWYYNVPLTTVDFKSVVQKRCPTHYGSELSTDVTIMSKLAYSDPTKRPQPMTFLSDDSLRDVVTPGVQEEEAADVLIFAVGEKIEYWSTTHNQWQPGFIGAVNMAKKTYDILHPRGWDKMKQGIKVTSGWMRKEADPARVRKSEKALRASVDERFIFRPSHLSDINAANANLDSPEASGILHVDDNVGRLHRAPLKPPVPARLNRIDEDIDEADIASPGNDKDIFRMDIELPRSVAIDVGEPKIYKNYIKGLTFNVDIYPKLLYGATGDFHSATMYCNLNPPYRTYPAVLNYPGYQTTRASWEHLPEKSNEGSCRIFVVATVTDLGQTKKVRSYDKWVDFNKALR